MAKKKNPYVSSLVKSLDSEYARKSNQYFEEFDPETFIDTGCYALNAVLSGSIFNGISQNKITAFAGEQATGKTFFVMSIVERFLDENPDATVFYFESESALTENMLKSRGIDEERFIVAPVATVQDFKTQIARLVQQVEATPKEERMPILLVLDSLGMLSTTKELEDTASGSEKKDMTRPGIIKAAFRAITLKLGMLGIPLLVTNHTYDNIGGYGPPKTMGGGGGLKFAASTIVFLAKSKDKDGTEVVGNLVRATINKGRLTRENSQVSIKLSYDTGLDPYFGLLDLALEAGIWKKIGNRVEIDGKTIYPKVVYKDPEVYFTQEVLEQIDAHTRSKFLYGSDVDLSIEEELVDG